LLGQLQRSQLRSLRVALGKDQKIRSGSDESDQGGGGAAVPERPRSDSVGGKSREGFKE
jgi:hypothetical protein